jgi:hypothetical protein
MLITCPKLIYVFLQDSNIFVLTVCLKLITFVFQIFSLFIPAGSYYFHSFGLDSATTAI